MAKIGKSLGKLGGPLLGGAGDVVDRLAQHHTQAGADAAREIGERIQGRAAHRASRRGGFLMQLLGGRWRPTQRGEDELIQRGDAWAQNENAQAARIVRRRHDAAYREGGVAAGKAALVESVGDRGRRAEQAIIQLINSQSYVEVQRSLIQHGPDQGKRITEVGAWQDVISEPGNSQLWTEVARRRPDLTPDVMQSAERTLGYHFDDVSGNQRPQLDNLSRVCLFEALRRFDAGILPGLHEGLFNEIERLNDPALAQLLFDRLRHIKNAQGTVGLDAIGTLAGPRETAIDAALAPIGQSYASI